MVMYATPNLFIFSWKNETSTIVLPTSFIFVPMERKSPPHFHCSLNEHFFTSQKVSLYFCSPKYVENSSLSHLVCTYATLTFHENLKITF
eukprot:c21339_g1_i1 orf=987-1256(+)